MRAEDFSSPEYETRPCGLGIKVSHMPTFQGLTTLTDRIGNPCYFRRICKKHCEYPDVTYRWSDQDQMWVVVAINGEPLGVDWEPS